MKEIIEKLNIKTANIEGLVSGEAVSYEEARDSIRNPENFAKRIEDSIVEVSPKVFLTSKTIELGEGNFVNVYDLSYDNLDSEFTTEILTRTGPIYPHRIFVNENRNKSGDNEDTTVSCINGAFFFLQDEILLENPKEIIYNFNIRNYSVVGLPSVTRPALFVTKDGHIHARELNAKGVVRVGGNILRWVGGEPLAHKKTESLGEDFEAILFNSACCSIEYEDPNDKTTLRKLRKDLNKTPYDVNCFDVVVSVDNDDSLYVSEINTQGGTDFFSGNFILQINKNKYESIKIGDKVIPETIDGLNINDIKSAMTTGPNVDHFLENDDHDINHDLSLGSFPPFDPHARYARSVMYEGNDGHVHMVVFDAVPRSNYMKGVTPKEAAEILPKDIKWSVFLDGGQSSRITFTSTETVIYDLNIDARGNKQYVRLNERTKTSQVANTDDQFLWSGRGRPISSMILLKRKKA